MYSSLIQNFLVFQYEVMEVDLKCGNFRLAFLKHLLYVIDWWGSRVQRQILGELGESNGLRQVIF